MELPAVHLADVWQWPASVNDKFAQGAFIASVLGISGHDQVLDEVHESVINRQKKAALHTSDAIHIEPIAHY